MDNNPLYQFEQHTCSGIQIVSIQLRAFRNLIKIQITNFYVAVPNTVQYCSEILVLIDKLYINCMLYCTNC